MEPLKEKVIAFLKAYEMDVEDIDMDKNVDAFLGEMEKGLAGKKSSLEMIPTYIETEKQVPGNEPVIVMDAGGTNVRVASIYFDENKRPVIDDFKRYSMPGISEEVSKDRFFRVLAGYLKSVADRSKKIGFCFSYPTQSFPNLDGRLIRLSKEIKAPEVVNEMIGENLNAALGAIGLDSEKHIVLLNDTVATLLAGKTYGDKNFDGYIGYILGTGTNCSYIERNKNITKKKGLDPDKSQIINIEAGGFGKSHRGRIDVLFDESTMNPGDYKFEKMIAGAYLGPLCLKVIQAAADDGLFSNKAGAALKKIREFETKGLNEFLDYPENKNSPLDPRFQDCNQDDVAKLCYLIDRMTQRAAKLSSVKLASALIKSDRGKNPARPMCIVVEGTTFYQLSKFKARVEYYLKTYLEEKHTIYYEIINVENSTLLGAAIAGLTN